MRVGGRGRPLFQKPKPQYPRYVGNSAGDAPYGFVTLETTRPTSIGDPTRRSQKIRKNNTSDPYSDR